MAYEAHETETQPRASAAPACGAILLMKCGSRHSAFLPGIFLISSAPCHPDTNRTVRLPTRGCLWQTSRQSSRLRAMSPVASTGLELTSSGLARPESVDIRLMRMDISSFK